MPGVAKLEKADGCKFQKQKRLLVVEYAEFHRRTVSSREFVLFNKTSKYENINQNVSTNNPIY